ncbi:hypothetical protein BZA77DRAFT_350780 [Pyronema omphalodes]|nr:hypothetical protein BZA77DRAFT_350780 [Pyronema omphalodes]
MSNPNIPRFFTPASKPFTQSSAAFSSAPPKFKPTPFPSNGTRDLYEAFCNRTHVTPLGSLPEVKHNNYTNVLVVLLEPRPQVRNDKDDYYIMDHTSILDAKTGEIRKTILSVYRDRDEFRETATPGTIMAVYGVGHNTTYQEDVENGKMRSSTIEDKVDGKIHGHLNIYNLKSSEKRLTTEKWWNTDLEQLSKLEGFKELEAWWDDERELREAEMLEKEKQRLLEEEKKRKEIEEEERLRKLEEILNAEKEKDQVGGKRRMIEKGVGVKVPQSEEDTGEKQKKGGGGVTDEKIMELDARGKIWYRKGKPFLKFTGF